VKKYELIEDVVIGASLSLKKGTEMYEYTGTTYGCCSGNEIPLTLEPGVTPFIGVDKDKIVEKVVVDPAEDKALDAAMVMLKLMAILSDVQEITEIDPIIEKFEEAVKLLKDNRDALS
jgi:hypothetical protein